MYIGLLWVLSWNYSFPRNMCSHVIFIGTKKNKSQQNFVSIMYSFHIKCFRTTLYTLNRYAPSPNFPGFGVPGFGCSRVRSFPVFGYSQVWSLPEFGRSPDSNILEFVHCLCQNSRHSILY